MSNEFPAFIKAEYVEGDAFSRFQRDLQQATDGFKRKFAEAGQEAQRAVTQALSIPRNSAGSLDLNVPQLRAAAEAQQARAIAAREVAQATALAAKAEGDYSTNARAAITATQALAREEEEAARAARAHADAAEQVQRALNLQKSATDAVVLNTGRGTAATRINTESQRANRFAMIQAGQQLQDITISLQSGQRATTVFAQQLPQLAFAFTDVGGKVGAFAQFLAGPYGVIVFGAITALGFLAEGYFSAGDEATKAKSAVQSLGDGIDFQKKSVDELINSIEELLKVQQKEIRSSKEAEQAKRADADAALLAAQNNLSYAISLLEVTKAKNADTRSARDPVSGDILYGLDRQLETALNSQIKSLSDALKRAEELSRGASIAPAERAARRRADPEFNVTERFADLEQAARNRRRAGTITERQLEDEIVKLTRAREAELKVVRETQKATRGVTDPGETTRFLSPITGTQSAPFGQQRGNRRHAGIDIAAPVGTAVRAPADGTIIEIGNDPGGYGNYVIIDHGRGTKTRYAHLLQTTRSKGSSVTAGEVFARSGGAPGAPGSGNSRGAHLHYEVLRNGKAVDPMKGLFPTDSLNVAREAEQALEQLTGRVQNLQDRFDPATKAANDFAEALRTIKEAEGAGLISEGKSLDLQISAMAQQAGELTRIQNEAAERFMKVFEPQQMRSAAEEYADHLENKWSAAQATAANAFVRAVEGADLMEAIFSGRFRVNDLLRLVNPNDSRLATGAAASDTGLNRLLFGRTSNFREIAEGKPEIQGGLLQSYTKSMNDFQDAMQSALEAVFGPEAENFGGVIGNALAGAQIGQALGGRTGRGIGAAIGAVAGSEFMAAVSGPLALASQANQIIGDIFGFEGGPLGVFTGLLTQTKRGSATIGGSGGNLQVASTRGNSRARVEQSSGAASEAITTLERIAQALGGSIDASRGSVSIGVRDNNIRVDTSGRGVTKTSRGAIDFGEDSAAAIKFATMDLIKDGVIVGLRASTQRLLQNAKDLDAAIQKAVDFQSVFDRLQARLDPVGAAISGIDREFSRLRSIFGEAAASVEELADLEKLYTLEREEAIKEANDRVLGSMKALLDDLRFGDNGRSLRDRLAAAQANFNPLAARVQAGDITAYDDFAEAARALLDIQRQFSGSQTAFFELQDRITAITAKVVEGGNVASILPGSTPTAQQQAQQSYDGSNVVTALDQLGDRLIAALGAPLRAINDNTAPGPVSGGRVDIPGFFVQNVRQI